MRKRTFGVAAAAATTLLLTGFSWLNTRVEWQYFGTPTNGGLTYELSNGGPRFSEYSRTLPAELPALPADILSTVGFMLPEGRDIRTNTQGLFPDSDDKTNLRFSEESDVWVTFLSEGAGYRNSVGYFIYDPANPPKYQSEVAEKIIFANTSMSTPLDPISGSYQNTVYLGKIPAGKALGFMIVSNGFSNTGRLYNGNRVAGVKDKPDSKWVFYSLRHLNPEANTAANLNVHTVLLKDLNQSSDGYQRMVLGFEDINREVGGDHDFNDVTLAIHVTPRRAIANLETISALAASWVADSDGDNVKNPLDDYPYDATKAFNRYYPSKNTYGTFAFEDKWPTRGDYDMNDMVIRYRYMEVLNAQRKTVSLNMEFRLDARGAEIDSGFALNLPGIPVSNIASATLTNASGATTTITPEAGQTEATFRIFSSAHQELPGTSAACPFANTQAECSSVPTKSYRLVVNFASPIPGNTLPIPYNPFIFRTADRSHEVHLPGKKATQLANAGLFGTKDDRSRPANGVSYVDSSNRPWALDLPTEWKYPNETIDLTLPYPNMVHWAGSAGGQHNNWYLGASVPKWLYVTH